MPRIHLAIDKHDNDSAQVYFTHHYSPRHGSGSQQRRTFLGFSAHIDTIEEVFGPHIASRLEHWKELDIDVDATVLEEEEEGM